jgi:[ribosomal protein S18]-alanine N-acetyltransferase
VLFAVRDFQPADFETLWRLDQDCFPPALAYSRLELKVYMRHRGAFTLVATSGENPLASDENHDSPRQHDTEKSRTDKAEKSSTSLTIAGFIVAHTGRIGHIVTIDVIASARRHGVGSLLLRAAEDRLRDSGSHSITLETAVDNKSALSFYKRHGYSVVRVWPRYYSNGVDALVMKKDLQTEAGE